ncbi:threonine/serine exporter family protein [Brevibacterium sp.]|uniref:threonine/serine ThrE exporter family protein n=1 Tax=Brevibacterium sp. TaxID=1701 RepID=UPI0028116F93|nr:threonine/serine exporter family protein [Brevibacterium sp.]
MTQENTEEATTAEVPLERSTAPARGARPGRASSAQRTSASGRGSGGETGSQALRELLDRSRHELARKPEPQRSKSKADQRGASQRVAQRVARRTVGRLVSGTAVNTQPIPIITALKGTPYQAPVQASEPSEEEARMVLDLAADIAAIMMRAGAGTSDIEVSVIAACAACGLATAEVDLTSNTLVVHYSTSDGRLLTVMRVNRGESTHYAKLASVHKLVSDLVDGTLGFHEARNRLDAIRSQRRPYQEWFVTGSWGMLVGSVVMLLGGGAIAIGLGIVMALLVFQLGKYIGRTSLPSFFIIVVQAAAATLIAMAAWNFGLVDAPQYLVAAGIVLLLPTQALFSAVQDALTNFPLTAAGRIIGVFMSFAGIVSGLAVGLVCGRALGLDPIEVLVPRTSVHVVAAIISMGAAAVVAMAGAVGMQATRRFILPAAFVGLASHITMMTLTLLDVDNVLASLLSATVAGFLSRPLALRLGAPAIVLTIPAIYTLLQGLAIFTAVYQIVAETDSTSFAVGLSSLFTAIVANAALAVGAVLGNYLARPLQRKKAKADQAAEEARGPESARGPDMVRGSESSPIDRGSLSGGAT